MQTYVQQIARNYLNNVVDDPKDMQAHPSFLRGLDADEFREGFLALLRLVRGLYASVADDPAGFGMLLREDVEHNAKNADYTLSNASFIRVPNLLYLLGALGEAGPGHSLAVDGGRLLSAAKELKLTGLPRLLAKLREHGFEITGLGKTVKEGDALTLAYPDSRFLPAALKAMADAQLRLNGGNLKKPRQYFCMVHPGLLEREAVRAPRLAIDDACRALGPESRAVAMAMHGAVSPRCKLAVRMGGLMRNDWSAVYTGIKSKKVLLSLQVEQDRLSAKLNLQHIGDYVDRVMELPGHIRETIRASGWECGRCHEGCAGPFAFTMEGQSYSKCRCGAFVFPGVSNENVPHCLDLLRLELACES